MSISHFLQIINQRIMWNWKSNWVKLKVQHVDLTSTSSSIVICSCRPSNNTLIEKTINAIIVWILLLIVIVITNFVCVLKKPIITIINSGQCGYSETIFSFSAYHWTNVLRQNVSRIMNLIKLIIMQYLPLII